jgi:flagellar hook-basal body complex protein FliE
LNKQGITEDTKRDYKAEYKKYGSSTKAKKYRAELNQYNRKKGTYGNGDGKDASHKGGKIAGFEKESTNRGRREKSRLKKENIRESINEAVEPQGNMAKIQKIVSRKQATKLGGVMIDMQSASLLMKLWDAVSDKDKEKMNKLNAKVLTTVIKKLWSRVNLRLPI